MDQTQRAARGLEVGWLKALFTKLVLTENHYFELPLKHIRYFLLAHGKPLVVGYVDQLSGSCRCVGWRPWEQVFHDLFPQLCVPSFTGTTPLTRMSLWSNILEKCGTTSKPPKAQKNLFCIRKCVCLCQDGLGRGKFSRELVMSLGYPDKRILKWTDQ